MLTIKGEDNRGLHECLSYSNTLNLVYSIGSSTPKIWHGEKTPII